MAVDLYTKDHGGNYPDSFGTLLLNEDITPEVFVSPGSNDTPSTGPAPKSFVANLTTGGHLSYVYLGPERQMMEGEFESSVVRDAVAGLGLADVKAFGLTWEDFQRILNDVGYAARVEIAIPAAVHRRQISFQVSDLPPSNRSNCPVT